MRINMFISLEENVTGYGEDRKKPSGHVTITSPGIVKCYIQDLKAVDEPYTLYLVSKKANKAIRMGELNSPRDTKQTMWKVDSKHIQGNSVTADEIDCVMIVLEGDSISSTQSVLVGYSMSKYLTTSMLEQALPKKAKPTIMPKPQTSPTPQKPTTLPMKPQVEVEKPSQHKPTTLPMHPPTGMEDTSQHKPTTLPIHPPVGMEGIAPSQPTTLPELDEQMPAIVPGEELCTCKEPMQSADMGMEHMQKDAIRPNMGMQNMQKDAIKAHKTMQKTEMQEIIAKEIIVQKDSMQEIEVDEEEVTIQETESDTDQSKGWKVVCKDQTRQNIPKVKIEFIGNDKINKYRESGSSEEIAARVQELVQEKMKKNNKIEAKDIENDIMDYMNEKERMNSIREETRKILEQVVRENIKEVARKDIEAIVRANIREVAREDIKAAVRKNIKEVAREDIQMAVRENIEEITRQNIEEALEKDRAFNAKRYDKASKGYKEKEVEEGDTPFREKYGDLDELNDGFEQEEWEKFHAPPEEKANERNKGILGNMPPLGEFINILTAFAGMQTPMTGFPENIEEGKDETEKGEMTEEDEAVYRSVEGFVNRAKSISVENKQE